jgi:hypothetical protein
VDIAQVAGRAEVSAAARFHIAQKQFPVESTHSGLVSGVWAMGRHASSTYLVDDDLGGRRIYRPRQKAEPIDLKTARDAFSGRRPVEYTHLLRERPTFSESYPRALAALGTAMMSGKRARKESNIPAGFTYFGQFVFHDMTYADKDTGLNLRTPALDLDSVFDQATLIHDDAALPMPDYLGIGWTKAGRMPLPQDLPRIQEGCRWGRPLIDDDRNDDFLPLAQCHLLLIKFYNAIARWMGLAFREANEDALRSRWEKVRQLWVEHFQSAVLHDYLPRVTDPRVYADVMANGRRLVAPCTVSGDRPWLPLEFSVAVARFGHSMVRDNYQPWNREIPEFRVTVQEFMDLSYLNSNDHLATNLHGLSTEWAINWEIFFEFSNRSYDCPPPLMASALDTVLAAELASLPECIKDDHGCFESRFSSPPFNLAQESLRRGYDCELATAQQLIRHLEAKIPCVEKLSCCDLVVDDPEVAGVFAEFDELETATPLWFYVLKEAEVLGGGQHLGPLGSRILMETIHAALCSSDHSILRTVNWRPVLPRVGKHAFTMVDMILFADNVNQLEFN